MHVRQLHRARHALTSAACDRALKINVLLCGYAMQEAEPRLKRANLEFVILARSALACPQRCVLCGALGVDVWFLTGHSSQDQELTIWPHRGRGTGASARRNSAKIAI